MRRNSKYKNKGTLAMPVERNVSANEFSSIELPRKN
jgi:hypothetical protein